MPQKYKKSCNFDPMRKILLAFFAILTLHATSAPKYEVRAVWLTTLGGLDWPRTKAVDAASQNSQKQELCHKLDELQRMGINLVYLQTRIRGTVIYPSKIEPWDGALTGRYDLSPGYDPLAFAIEECHKRGMECHAWVVTLPAFKINGAKALGRRSLLYTHPRLLYKQSDMYYLDPSLEGTTEYLESICNEITDNYDIDGIHFDYIRYPERTKPGRADWRRDNITHIVSRLYHTIKQRKPWIKVSCSPVGKYHDTTLYSARGWNAYEAVYQDAVLWLKEGIMDMISPMMYFKDNHFYPFCAQWQEQSHGRIVAPGLGIYFLSPREKNWDLVEITRQLQFIRTLNMGGAAYFRAQFLLDDVKGLAQWIRHHYYPEPALVPPTPHASPSTCSADHSMQAPQRYVLYASKTYPVDTDKAENLVRVYWGKPDYNQLAAAVWGMNVKIMQMDEWGNELSTPVYESSPVNTNKTRRKVIRITDRQ